MPSALERRLDARQVHAGAARVDTRRQMFGRQLWRPNAQPWQTRSWTFYDSNGDLHRGYTIKANTIAKVRVYGAWQAEPDDEPVPFDEALANPDIDTTGLTQAWADLAEQTVERIAARDGGPQEIQRLLALNLDVPGEGWLLGRDDGQGEHWSVHSVEQIVWQGGGYVLYDLPGRSRGTGTPIGPDDVLIRIWRKHPRFPNAADSAFRALLDDLEQQDLLRKTITSSLTNRATQNGLLIVDSNIDLPGALDQAGDTSTADGVYEALSEAMMTAMRDNSSAAAHVPVVVSIEGADNRKISEAIHHQTLDKPMHEANVRYAVDLDQKILRGADFPPEWANGIGESSTFANARQVSADGYSQDVDPTVLLICAGYTSAWLQPVMAEAGCPPEVVRRMVAWRDPDTVITKPDRAKFASEVSRIQGQRILSDAALRAAMGFDEGDAPDESDIMADTPQAALPEGDTPEPGPNAGELAASAHPAYPPPLVLTAASPSTQRLARVSSRLADIDARLLTRLHHAADRAVTDGLNQAGRQIKARAQGSPALRKQVQGVAPCRVYAALSPDQRLTLAAGDDDLTGSLSGLEEQYTRWTAQAQALALRSARTVGAWSDDDVEAVEAQQDDDRAAGWVFLAAALLGLMGSRMNAPDVIAPTVGEFDPDVTAPFGITRASVAVAGGATLDPLALAQGRVVDALGNPAGGVGDGPVILGSLLQVASVGTGAYVWVHGAPPTPFPPHEDLDGQEFTSWEDPLLTNNEGWPDVTWFAPGDHVDCTCTAEVVLVVE